MKITLPDFQRANVLVVGDIMLDRYWSGVTNRISPEAPVPIVKVSELEDRPGGSANVAMNIAALGAQVNLIGLIGQDEAGQILTDKLQAMNIACHFVTVDGHPTITKLRILARHQQLLRLDFEEQFNHREVKPLLQRIEQQLPHIDAIVFSDYGKGTLTEIQSMIQLAKQTNIPLLIDPKGSDFNRYYGATLLTPNMSEFEAVVGVCQTEQEIIEKGLQLIDSLSLSALLVTRSEQGMTLLQPKRPPLHLPAQAQEVYDVTGAGDTVISLLATALAAGSSLEEACFLANAAAGIVVGKLGTSTVSQTELEQLIHIKSEAGFGVIDQVALKVEMNKARLQGERIVMTNGIFDILHEGHVNYLAQARQLGDRLIVAVNSDESTKRLKGERRPINPLAQRMAVLAALAAVDWVVDFTEDTPQRLIAELLPDVLVKGGDYQPEQIAGHKEVLAAGGEVKVLSFTEGRSTTKIIDVIQQKGQH